MTYIYLMKRLTSEETVDAKRAFETYARNRGVSIRHYHCDNGRFADNAFIKDVDEKGQTISFCAAYAHLQNGRAEKRLRDLQEQVERCSYAQYPGGLQRLVFIFGLMLSDIQQTLETQSQTTKMVAALNQDLIHQLTLLCCAIIIPLVAQFMLSTTSCKMERPFQNGIPDQGLVCI